jgi:lysophospholipase L1-like esterase
MEAAFQQMIQEASAANIQVVLATEFPSLYGWPYNPVQDILPPMDIVAGDINECLAGDPPPGFCGGSITGATIANYWNPLSGSCGYIGSDCDYLPGLSSDDIAPNAAGYAAMYPVLASAVQRALSSTPSSSAKPKDIGRH